MFKIDLLATLEIAHFQLSHDVSCKTICQLYVKLRVAKYMWGRNVRIKKSAFKVSTTCFHVSRNVP